VEVTQESPRRRTDPSSSCQLRRGVRLGAGRGNAESPGRAMRAVGSVRRLGGEELGALDAKLRAGVAGLVREERVGVLPRSTTASTPVSCSSEFLNNAPVWHACQEKS
jgi:hypothetical protein